MIILDTNVVSEAMRPSAHPSVKAWLDAQVAETIYISSITVAEMRFRIDSLPTGNRKHILTRALDALLDVFDSRVLAFDKFAAQRYAEIAVRAREAGRGLPLPDGYIAAIAAAHGYAVATRDASPFLAAGVVVIDPWVAPAGPS